MLVRMSKRLLTVRETAEMLGVKEPTIRSWILLRKNLPFVRVGRAIRFPLEAVEKFIRDNTIPPKGRK